MPIFEEPNDNMKRAYETVRALSCHQSRLADVKIRVLAAYATRDKEDEPRGEALLRNGDPALGKIRIMALEDRTAGTADVRVLLHGDRWGQLSAAMQRGVLDQCLTRIEVVTKDDKPRLDDLGRPKLRKRKWDFQLCGFHAVAKRNGKSSIEVHTFQVLFSEHGQLYLPHLDGDVADIMPLPQKPKAALAVAADPSSIRGSLSTKLVCERIVHLESAATVLALVKLELADRPRKGVVSALENRVRALVILPDFILVKNGKPPKKVILDIAAAVLVTTPKNPDMDMLDRLVPECRDEHVLSGIIEDERYRDDSREEVIEVVERRLRELAS